MGDKNSLANSLNPGKGKLFEEQVQEILGTQWKVILQRGIPIPIGNPPKEHRFDLVSQDRRIVIECKNYGWTEQGNVPSAKCAFINEAVFYLSLLAGDHDRYVGLRKATHPTRKETLACYYWRTYRHLLGAAQVLEVDVEEGKAMVVDEKSVTAMRPIAAAIKPAQQPIPKTADGIMAREAGGRYWVYENWTHKFAKVHLADCSHCNQGRGSHGKSSDRNGAWNGPYVTRTDAFAFAKSTGQPEVKGCSFCGP